MASQQLNDKGLHERELVTIGYSGKTLPCLVDILRRAGVNLVVDVRALPRSRKKGFSKSALSAALKEAAIEYVHLRVAGNPYRDQKSDVSKCLALYSAHVDRHPEIVEAVDRTVDGRVAALLCFEANPRECHRSVIVDRLTARNPHRMVEHL
jgi:uncharacterized protein (DUF488 family)